MAVAEWWRVREVGCIHVCRFELAVYDGSDENGEYHHATKTAERA